MSSKPNVGIINYGMGNLRSVENACRHLGAEVRVLASPSELDGVSHVILPGVGAFGDGMRNLRQRGWVDPVRQLLRQQRPFLGICLGMQLLAEKGREFGEHEGLGWIEGTVEQLQNTAGMPGFRLPHIGWNGVELRPGSALAAVLPSRPCFYFVHSYVLVPRTDDAVVGWCEHGSRFPALLHHGTVLAAQFHPEKSQRHGLAVLKFFLGMGGKPC